MLTDPLEIVDEMKVILADGARWHKGSGEDATGTKACLLRANGKAAGIVFYEEQTAEYVEACRAMSLVERTMLRVIAEQFPDRTASKLPSVIPPRVPEFNDHPDTTWQDVSVVLDKTRTILEERV